MDVKEISLLNLLIYYFTKSNKLIKSEVVID